MTFFTGGILIHTARLVRRKPFIYSGQIVICCSDLKLVSIMSPISLPLAQFYMYLAMVFRLDALAKALSVIATATWLASWVSVTAGIVSKRLNLSENFLHHLVGPSFKHLGPLTPIPNSKGNPFIGGVKYTGGNWRFSFDFRRTSPFISETVRDRPMVTMER